MELKKPTLAGNDILFECQHCGKSLTIDCRGAGLNIRCPQCDNELEVPIPEGFDLAELDKEITTAGTLNGVLEATLAAPEAEAGVSAETADRINKLKAEVEALHAQRQYLAQQYADMLKTIKTVSRQVEEFRVALDELGALLNTLTGPQNDETQKLG